MGIWGEGLGRQRTKLGKWMEQNEVTQAELHKWSSVSRPTITKLCGDVDYEPSDLTKRSIISALNQHGQYVKEADFW